MKKTLVFIMLIGMLNIVSFAFASSEGLSVLEMANTHNDSSYRLAVNNWPDDISIWDNLKSKKAKLIFLNYLKSIDDTNLRDYHTFENLCTGFATQFFVRFSKYANFQNDEISRMAEVGILPASYPTKFKIPAFMSSYYGHYFNSVLIDESKPSEFLSYVLVEPQNDLTITKESSASSFAHYAERFPVSVDVLQKFDVNKRFITKSIYNFVFISGNKFNLIGNKKYAMLLNFFFVAETVKQNYDAELGGKDFRSYIQNKIRLFSFEKNDLKEIFKLIEGKLIRETQDEKPIPLTLGKFKLIVGQENL